MINNIPDIEVAIIKNGVTNVIKISDEFKDKNIVVFGVPGAFTPTCSEAHFPEYIELYDDFLSKNIQSIYCISVNDPYVMDQWIKSYKNGKKIFGIADGNGDIIKSLNLSTDKSKNFMGMRSNRFAMIVYNNVIKKLFIEKPGKLEVSSAKKILMEI